jgi:hypothetical protein
LGHFLPPSFVVGGGGCSSVSGRQKTRFSEKPASIDKNDRVGKPLVRYFEVAATSAPPLFGFTFIVKAMGADLDRAAGAPKRTASRSLGQVGGAGLRRQQAASSCNRSR